MVEREARKAMAALSQQMCVSVLKAMAEPTRLRVLALLTYGELNVKDLTRVLGQSQPRISRHLKLLCEAGLVERAPEGSWVYFRLADQQNGSELASLVLGAVDANDAVLLRDRARAEALRAEREAMAQAYFQTHANEWDSIRALHVAEDSVEAAIATALDGEPLNLLIDLGTGTGRMLELLAGAIAGASGSTAARRCSLTHAPNSSALDCTKRNASGRHLRPAARRCCGRRRRHAPGDALFGRPAAGDP